MKKDAIWNSNIPYNTGAKKATDMDLVKKGKIKTYFNGLIAIFDHNLDSNDERMDSFTWDQEIRKGEAEETYSDVPYIIPRVVKGSKKAVLIAPGGGFVYKSMKEEGEKIADFLNEAGISAFILWYRINPYPFPVPYLDMQRAIRYIRFHKKDYGIEDAKLGIMGFSAGAYVAGACVNYLGNKPVEYDGYEPDAVDEEDATPDFVGLLYPVTQYKTNPNMLSIMTRSVFRKTDAKGQQELYTKYSLTDNLQHSDIPYFLCYGTQDQLQGMDDFAKQFDVKKLPHKTVVLEGARHGFGDCKVYYNKKFAYWKKEYIDWIKSL